MELDIEIHKGGSDKPVIILVHGLGMDRNFWLDPVDTKVLGKNVPIKVFAATKPRPGYLPQSLPTGQAGPPGKAGSTHRGRFSESSRSDVPKFRGRIKRGVTIGDIPKKINNLWFALRDRGFNLVCWSQRRPVGPINSAVEELEEIYKLAGRIFPGCGFMEI